MASLTQWTWVWVDFGSWWWTGRPGVLCFIGVAKSRTWLSFCTELKYGREAGNRCFPSTFEDIWSLILDSSLERRRQWQSTPVLLPGKSHGWRSLVGCSPWGREESDTTGLHFHFSLSCIGEGNGNPLQCSCLENPRDGAAWWAAIYGIAQSQTRLKQLSSSSSSSLEIYETNFCYSKTSGLQIFCCSSPRKLVQPVGSLPLFLVTKGPCMVPHLETSSYGQCLKHLPNKTLISKVPAPQWVSRKN